MKICFLITGLGIGGAEKCLLDRVPKFKFNKFIISLTNYNKIGKEIERKGVKVYYLGLNKYNLPLVISRFGKIIKNEKPDILDTYLIHANLFGRIFGRIFGIKRIISSVRNDYSGFRLISFLDRFTQNFVKLYIINSIGLLHYVFEKINIPLTKIKIIPNGINLEELNDKVNKNYNVRKELGLKENTFIGVCVARLYKQKNISTLIRAIKLVDRNIFLIIVGEGPERKNFEKLSGKLNLKNQVFFLGLRKDVLNIVNSSNVFILPSLREGMSNALLEAMALKKCCIVSDIPQNRELIKNRFNGITFNKKNERDLAKKIEIAYKNQNLEPLKQEAYKLIKKKYQNKNLIKKYEKVIEEIYYIRS